MYEQGVYIYKIASNVCLSVNAINVMLTRLNVVGRGKGWNKGMKLK